MDKAGQPADQNTGDIAMTQTKIAMMKREDRLVGRTLLGFLSAPLGLLLGAGLIISL